MADALRFFVQYEAAIYFLLALGAIIYLYRFWLAWQELQLAIYGLERTAARGRLNQATITLFLLFLTGVIVFVIVTFAASSLPAQALLATPTLDLSIENTQPATTLTPASGEDLEVVSATPLPTVAINPAACLPTSINISEPQSGDTIRGAVEVVGTASVDNFGFYKFEVARADEELWLTIQAGRSIVRDDVLVENWDTSRLPPGDYVLQLVITDRQGDEFPPCRIPVRIDVPLE